MSLFLQLDCTETDNGLTTSGGQVHETIEPTLSNSLIADSTKSLSPKADRLLLRKTLVGSLENGIF